jgi:hypothetical protein
MRKLAFVALIALIGLVPFTASAQAPAPAPTAVKTTDNLYPLVLAAGATAGIVAVNYLTWGVGNLPYSLAVVPAGPIISPAAAAASRIFVITSGVTGAWIASWLYGK